MLSPQPLLKVAYSNQPPWHCTVLNQPRRQKYKDLEKVPVGIDLEKFFQIDLELPPQEKEELIDFLRENVDVFAWDSYEAPGVDLGFICHHLNVNPSVTPKKQPPRRPSKEHANVVRDEVMKLKKGGLSKKFFTLNGWPIL